MAAPEVPNPDHTNYIELGPRSGVEFLARLSRTTVIFAGFVCAALVVTSVFLGLKTFSQAKKATGSSPSVKAEIAKPERSPADWALREAAGLHVLAPSDFHKSDPATISPPNPDADRIEARLLNASQTLEAMGGGFFVVVVHAVARPEAPLHRDLEQAAWNSVDKLNPALVAPNADKSVCKTLIAGVHAYRASCRAINQSMPARFETVTFELGDDWWLVSILVTDPTGDDLNQIEQIMDSIGIATP